MTGSSLNAVIPSWGSPTLEGFDLNNVQEGQRISGIKRQFVRFYKKKIVQPRALNTFTAPTGETKILSATTDHIEREMVEIITPGDKNTVDDFAQDFHKREHWNAYKNFRNGNVAPMGQSVDEANFITPPIATELRYLGVHTVEQLADAADILCERVPNGWELREFARAVVKANAEQGSNQQALILQAELAEAKKMIAELQGQMQGVLHSEKQEEAEFRRSGRPRKIIEEA